MCTLLLSLQVATYVLYGNYTSLLHSDQSKYKHEKLHTFRLNIIVSVFEAVA